MRYLFALLAALFLFANVYAADQNASATAPATELKPQTKCPVMGGPIDSTAYTDIQGQRVYHCCMGCAAKLKADPDKYFKKAAAEGVLFQNIQKACPVTGKPFDKAIYTDYVGRRVYFATAEAKAQFAKSPGKYLKVLDKQVNPKPAEDQHGAMQHGSLGSQDPHAGGDHGCGMH